MLKYAYGIKTLTMQRRFFIAKQMLYASKVSDPFSLAFWIRFRIRNTDPDPGT